MRASAKNGYLSGKTSVSSRVKTEIFFEPGKIFDFTLWSLDPLITFTRVSGGSYYGPTGVLSQAASWAPRFSYDPVTLEPVGLMIEEARTNYCHYSSNTGSWSYTDATVTAETFTAPDGSAQPILLAGTAASPHRALVSGFPTGPAGNVLSAYGCYLYLPPGSDVTRVWLRMRDSGANGQAALLQFSGTGANATLSFVTSSPFGTNPPPSITASSVSIKKVHASGIFRVVVISQASNAATTVNRVDVGFSVTSSENVAGTANTKIGIWGQEVQNGAFETSHIPTSGASATRSAETVSILDVSSFFNPDEGTIYAECYSNRPTASSPGTRIFQFEDGTSSNNIRTAGASFQVISGGVVQANIATGIDMVTWKTKLAGAYAANDFAASANGAISAIDSAWSIPSISRLYFGGGTSAGTLGWSLLQLKYWPKRLNNTTIQKITA